MCVCVYKDIYIYMIYLCAMCNYVTYFICNTISRIVYLSMYTFHKTFQASLPAHTHLTATDSFKNWNQKNTRCFFPWQHGDSTNLTKTKKNTRHAAPTPSQPSYCVVAIGLITSVLVTLSHWPGGFTLNDNMDTETNVSNTLLSGKLKAQQNFGKVDVLESPEFSENVWWRWLICYKK